MLQNNPYLKCSYVPCCNAYGFRESTINQFPEPLIQTLKGTKRQKMLRLKNFTYQYAMEAHS